MPEPSIHELAPALHKLTELVGILNERLNVWLDQTKDPDNQITLTNARLDALEHNQQKIKDDLNHVTTTEDPHPISTVLEHIQRVLHIQKKRIDLLTGLIADDGAKLQRLTSHYYRHVHSIAGKHDRTGQPEMPN